MKTSIGLHECLPLRTAHRASRRWLACLALLAAAPAQAFVVNIGGGQRAMYLQVGAGRITGGTFNNGGTPGNNATVNQVSVTVPPTSVGAGPQPMTTDSAVANSPYDGFSFCTVPAEVFVGGFYRGPASQPQARLTVTSPASLVSPAGDTLPFTSISWVSGGAGDATPTIPSGTFSGGTQTLLNVERNTWFESCLRFVYSNNIIAPAGTFTERVTYTMVVP